MFEFNNYVLTKHWNEVGRIKGRAVSGAYLIQIGTGSSSNYYYPKELTEITEEQAMAYLLER